jgi:hypothetical protein
MPKARQAASAIADWAGARVGAAQVARARRRARGGRMLVLDVDNTLADSWPTLVREWPGERARLDAIQVLPHMKAAVHDRAVARGDSVLFLTHRHWKRWRQTVRWLRRNGFAASAANVVLVARPADKVSHVRRCAEVAEVTYWDDLSHSHEHGEPVFYDEVIAAVRDLPVEYRGWNDIRSVIDHEGS